MIFFFLFWAFGAISAAQLPKGVKLCHRSDPNFQQCLARNIGDALKYFADGYRELAVPKLEPLFIEKLEIDRDGQGSVSLEQRYRNVNVHGITNSMFTKNFKLEIDNGCSWSMEAATPVIRMEADYEIKGQLLVFPINAQGRCNITQYDVLVVHQIRCEKYTKKNASYIRILNYTMDMKTEKIHYDFDNVFPGNEQISNEIVKTLNENSVSIFNEVRGGMEKAFSVVYMQFMNNVFSRLPWNEIFLD